MCALRYTEIAFMCSHAYVVVVVVDYNIIILCYITYCYFYLYVYNNIYDVFFICFFIFFFYQCFINGAREPRPSSSLNIYRAAHCASHAHVFSDKHLTSSRDRVYCIILLNCMTIITKQRTIIRHNNKNEINRPPPSSGCIAL